MKKYCTNCKYYRYVDDAFGGYDDCKYPAAIGINRLQQYIETGGNPSILNQNNNCKYYKRKWWKFWIKQIKSVEIIVPKELYNKLHNPN